MKILLYGLNYAPELTGIGKYSGEMCEWLAANGHDVRVICAPPYYPEWSIGNGYKGWKYQLEVINGVSIYRCPLFVPRQPTTISRILHLFSFSVSSFPAVFMQWSWNPEVVICIEPTFFCVPGALLFCGLRRSRSMLHIQDFELDAMLGLGMGKIGWTASFAKIVESWFMRRFDIISSISYSMLYKAGQKIGQNDKLFYFPNWVDTDFLTPEGDSSFFRRVWGISDTTRVVLYSGNLGKKQGLEIILHAAKKLEEQPDLLFLIVGAGVAQSQLKQLADQLQLHNLKFYPLQPYEYLPGLMALADIHLIVQKKGAADSVLPSKLTTILAVGGNSVLTAEADTELGILCQKYPGISKCIEPENVDALVEAIKLTLAGLPQTRVGRYNKIARQFALDNLKKDRILSRLVDRL